MRLPIEHRVTFGARSSTSAFAVALLSAWMASASAQTCPQSCLFGNLASDSRHVCSTELAYSQRYESHPGHPFGSLVEAGYNAFFGHFRVYVWVWMDDRNSADVSIADRFRIVGPESSSSIPLDLTARLRCVARVGYYTMMGAWLLEGEGPLSPISLPITTEVDSTLELQLQHRPNEEFQIRYGATVSMENNLQATAGGQRTQLVGDLTFAGLPAGYSVVSCQGYRSVVAVDATTWTLVKSRYR